MKKLFLLTIVFIMTLSLAACGGKTNNPNQSIKPSESASMVDVTTEQGISLKLPIDMVSQENKTFANTTTAEIASFGIAEADPAAPLSKWTQDEFIASELSDRKELVIISYDNNKQINGKAALVCKFSFTSDKGNAITAALIMIDDGTKEYIISLLYSTDNAEGSLAKNLNSCIDSITVNAAK